jgi:FixJ family two-component response regulator
MLDQPTVFVVDDDPGTLRSISWLIERAGLALQAYACGADFLNACDPGQPGCLLLDLRLPERDGLAVMEDLAARHIPMPVIMITGDADVASCVDAFKKGVFDFLEKPLDEAQLLDCVRKALAEDARSRQKALSPSLFERLSRLTPRERQVFDLLVAGKTLKQIANACSITVQSVWRHRRRVFTKCLVHSEVELVRLMLTPNTP